VFDEAVVTALYKLPNAGNVIPVEMLIVLALYGALPELPALPVVFTCPDICA
jgi:hypothetical protein